jgi:hypothetical protein
LGGKSDPPDPPDYGPIAEASEKQFELSHKLAVKQFKWAKKTYRDDKALADQVTDILLPMMEDNARAALADRARYEELFQPLEEDLAAEAAAYGTPEQRAKEMGAAQANVAQQFEGARQAAQQQLESFGINPSATRYAALDIGVRAQQAAAAAAAGTTASNRVDDVKRALRSEAINVGRGYPGQIAGTYGTAQGAGGQAIQGNLATTGSGAATMGTGPQWMGAGNNALNTWGNTLNMGFQNELDAWNAQQQQSSGWGSALGLIGGMGMKMFGFDKGGAVPVEASPSGGAIPDDVGIAVSAEEFIVPADVVRWKGEEFFQKQIEQSRTKRQELQAIPDSPRAAPPPVPPQQALPQG